MRSVAVIGFAAAVAPHPDGRSDAELLAPVVDQALMAAGVAREEVGVVASASSEFLGGVVGTVMAAFDALPCWPPRTHVHLEGEGALAFFEAWVRLQAGEADVALACAFSRPLAPEPRSILSLQLDPYLVAPLAPDPRSLAALQARALIETGRYEEIDFARVTSLRRRNVEIDALLAQPYVASPLRALDCSSVCSGAAAVVLAEGDRAKAVEGNPAWIRGIEHGVESAALGRRDLARAPSIEAAAATLGLPGSIIDVAEVHAPFSHQELIITDALGVKEIESLNPSGGALPADPLMATGLIRIGEAARAILEGDARLALAHATNGPCLQHNVLCLLEAEP